MDSDQIIRDFCAAWGRGDVEVLMNAFTDDAVYHNIPMDPAKGKDAIRAVIEGFMKMSPGGVDFEILNQVTAGNLVLNERIDTFVVDGKKSGGPVAGVFELDADGKIKAWRDYFDMATFMTAMS